MNQFFVFLIFSMCLLSQGHCSLFYSQASQDRFVALVLSDGIGKQEDGFYLEIGAAHPIHGNNTYFLERNFRWKGVSLDIDPQFQNQWSLERSNPLLVEDATKADYQTILASFPQWIDYLSLDIDCSYDVVLQKILSENHRFKVITIEHDFYRFGDKYRADERKILESYGYYLLCPDVSVFFGGIDAVFEDWWIHPDAFPSSLLSILKSLDLNGKRHEDIIDLIQTTCFKNIFF